MNLVIKKKKSVNQVVKIAVVILIVFSMVGLAVRLTKKNSNEPPGSGQSLGPILTFDAPILIPIISLKVPDDSNEHVWTNAFAITIEGKTEVAVSFGRADVITENYAVEVDFLSKWKEGLGQALHYGDATGLVPVLALITLSRVDDGLLKQIERLCTSKGVKVVLLVPES